jgi:hypothetical protein
MISSSVSDELRLRLPGELQLAKPKQIDGVSPRLEITREFRQTFEPPGLPPSILHLKVDAPITMLLRTPRPREVSTMERDWLPLPSDPMLSKRGFRPEITKDLCV